MLISAFYTLFKMRNSLYAGINRSVYDVKKALSGHEIVITHTEKDLNFGIIG